MSSFFGGIPSIPKLRPQYCLGAGLDIPFGAYHIGEHGQSVLNSGMSLLNSVAGPGNSYKTAIMLYMMMVAAERYRPFQCTIYDTEISLNYDRLNKFSRNFARLSQMDHSDDELSDEDKKFIVTSSTEMMGDVYFKDVIKRLATEKVANAKSIMYTTPFLMASGAKKCTIQPTGIMIDSISKMEFTEIETKFNDKAEIGGSGFNMLAMREGKAKKDMIGMLPRLADKGSLCFGMVAHIGKTFELDPYAPKDHKLTHSKRGATIKGASGNFEFLNNMLLEIFNAGILNNPTKGTGVLYPKTERDREADCKDLMKVDSVITRNKHGISGPMLEFIISQREGLLPHLSQFHFLKENGFGLEGNKQNYALALRPDVTVSRTTVRGKIDTDCLLQRAIEFQAELLQIKQIWEPLEDDLMCEPAVLYNDLKKMGYDWDVLLATRGYWVFEENEAEEELPYLSTMDLLRMRKGLYKPYWLK